MNPKAARFVVRSIGAITCIFGLLTIYMFVVIFAPAALHSASTAMSLLFTTLVFVVPLVAFGAYIVYLGYQLSFRLSRSAFERIYFGVIIFLAVILCRNFSGLLFFLVPVCLGLVGLFTRPILSKRLFPEDQ
jgi:hypothetical protein